MPRSKPVEHVLLLGRRAVGLLTSLRALVALLAALLTRRRVELWIGDSHAVCLNMGLHVARWSRGADGQVVLHLGGRLLWSTATKGHPPAVHRVARWVRRLSTPGQVVPFLCAGEIDIRCHLVPRSEQPGFDLDFVGDYVARAVELAHLMSADRVVVVAPTPQSDRIPQVARYPIRGTLAERVAMTGRIRDRLHAEARARDGDVEVLVLDLNDDLADPDGAMRADLTDDGVHTNAAGIAAVRRRVA
jgi:lysophospholipase L1-like esterase